jgi:hypothetical protein
VTRNNKEGPYRFFYWNEQNLNLFSTINWRASLVPAAAVIPAPIAYVKVVAAKKLVVGFLLRTAGPLYERASSLASASALHTFCA